MIPNRVFSKEEVKKIDDPIVITSKMLTADNKNHTAIFEKAVVAKTRDMTLYADKMLIFYSKDTGDIIKVDAIGGVKLIRENRVITSREATYYTSDEKVIFTGEPKVEEDEKIVTGEKMTYLLNEDRFLIEGSKVLLINKR